MNDARLFLIRHGVPIVFAAVLIEQLGLPLPAIPWLLAAGALVADGHFSMALAMLTAVAACLIADALWFYLGRYRGGQVLGWLCRISLEPDSCVRKTQDLFTKYGWRGIVVAKFVPGLSTLAPPMAGMSKINAGKFLMVDGLGSLLYGGCYILLGYFFANQLGEIAAAMSSIGASALAVVVAAVAGYIAYKYWQRRRLLHELHMMRITVEELRKIMTSGRALAILDVRSSGEFTREAPIEGAIHLTIEDVREGRYKIPLDREVVVYCSCPNEATAARVALLLRRHGFANVRPLLGGLDAWNAIASTASTMS